MSTPPLPLNYAGRHERRPVEHFRGTSRGRQFAVLLLLAAGVQLWIGLGRGQLGEKRQMIGAALAVVATAVIWRVRGSREGVAKIVDGINSASGWSRGVTAVVLTLASMAFLYFTAKQQARDFSPILHDEYTYQLQARMMASGKLWLAKHELADFFESFHLITDRVYAAKYGPGTAVVYAVGMWLGIPPWIVSLVLSGGAVGLIYLVVGRLLDNRSGLLAALMLVSLGMFRRTSIMTMSQPIMLVLALGAVWAYLHWRERLAVRWMAVMGVCLGWGALCRPVDAVCVGVVLAIAVMNDMASVSADGSSCCSFRSLKRALIVVLPAMVAAAPFLAVQLIYNKGITGSFTKLPWDYYAKRDDPYDVLGRPALRGDVKPVSSLAQKRIFAEEFTLPAFRQKIGVGRLANVVDRTTRTLAGPPLEEQEKQRLVYGALPTPVLVALLPVGLLSLSRRRWVIVVPVALFLLIYSQYTFFLVHYAVAIVPGVILLTLAAKETIRSTWPGASGPIGLGFGLVIIALCLTALPQINRSRNDQWFDAPLLRDVDAKLAKLPAPAIVLFKFDAERMVHEEPVYNISTANPDDAAVIRAHDLGERNSELFAYYAKKSPGRTVYRYDEKDGTIARLGDVSELTTRSAGEPDKLNK